MVKDWTRFDTREVLLTARASICKVSPQDNLGRSCCTPTKTSSHFFQGRRPKSVRPFGGAPRFLRWECLSSKFNRVLLNFTRLGHQLHFHQHQFTKQRVYENTTFLSLTDQV